MDSPSSTGVTDETWFRQSDMMQLINKKGGLVLSVKNWLFVYTLDRED